jgi:hypothetical protein
MNITEKLEVTRDETLSHFQLAEPKLARSYAAGKWPIRFILHHLADAETVLFDRIRRVLSEGRRVLWVFDQDAWAKGLDYSQLPLDISRRIYESVRSGMIYTTRRAVISNSFTAKPESELSRTSSIRPHHTMSITSSR